jgi:hypothetical protein
MTISATLRKRDKLAAQLTWLATGRFSTYLKIDAMTALRREKQ